MDQFQQNGVPTPPSQQPQQSYGQQPNFQQYQTPPTDGMPPYNGMTASGAEEIVKKSKAPKIIAGIVGAVVLIGAGSGIAYAASDTVKNFTRANFTSDESYFAWVMEKNAKESSQQLRDQYARYLDLMDSSKSKIGISAELSDATKDLIADELSGTSADGLHLDSAAIEGEVIHQNGNYGVTASLIANDTNILDANASYDHETQTAYIQIPTLSEDYISMSTGDLVDEFYSDWDAEDMPFSPADFSSDTLKDIISPDELEEMYVRYINTITDELDDVSVNTGETVEVGDLEFSTTEIQLDLDEKNSASALQAVLKEAKKDDVIKNIAVNYGGMSESEYTDGLQELIDELSTMSNSEFEFSFSLYVDSTGTICGMELDIPNAGNVFTFAGFDSKHAGMAWNVKAAGEEIVDLTIELDRDGKTFNGSGEGSLTMEGNTYTASLDIDNFEVVDKELGYVKGSLTISIPDITDGFTIDLDSDGKSQTISADVVYEGDNYGTISLIFGTDTADGSDIQLPGSDATVYDIETDDGAAYENSMNLDGFYSTLEEALGISDGEAFLNELFADDDDYYNDLYDDDYYDDLYDDLYDDDDAGDDDNYDDEDYYADLSHDTLKFGNATFSLLEACPELVQQVDTTDYETLEPGDIAYLNNEDYSISISVENKTNSTLPIEQCSIYEIYITDPGSNFSVNGLTFGSKIADIEKAFGIDIEDDAFYITITDSNNSWRDFTFSLFNGEITGISVADYD